jgi:hypothetical protein
MRQRMSWRSGAGPGAAFRVGPDTGERGPDRGLPRGRDPLAPPLPGDPEVGAEFAGVLQPGGAVVLGEGEFLRHVRDRVAHQMEGDPPGRSNLTVSRVTAVSRPPWTGV